ncbi:MAG: NTP transferase domain-containing protein [Bacteroidota bacterium]
MKKQHQKHPKLTRTQGDRYARTDIALVGSSSEVIEPFIKQWTEALATQFRSVAIISNNHQPQAGSSWQQGAEQCSSPFADWNEYDERIRRSTYDVALVSGSHYFAPLQVVLIDQKYVDTLERYREDLAEVIAVIRCPGTSQLPTWLKEHLAAAIHRPVVCKLEEATDTVLPLLFTLLSTRVPALNALILTGGESSRMCKRKADLVYRGGITEAQRLARLTNEVVPGQVYISVATAEQPTVDDFPNLADRFLSLGPAGAIASAFLTEPDAAWLVVACDLPLLEISQLQQLIAARDSRQFATAYRLAGSPFPEPLVAIYEPRAYMRFLQFLGLGYACPRKMLMNSPIREIETIEKDAFFNANTAEEREMVMGKLAR